MYTKLIKKSVIFFLTLFMSLVCIKPIGANASDITDIVSEAYCHLGAPYVYGTNGPKSFDCSGFTSYVYKNSVGIDIGRTTYDQIKCGRAVSKDDLKVGDLIFPNIHHVELYIGNGLVIHAPKTGDVVKVAPVGNIYAVRRILD